MTTIETQISSIPLDRKHAKISAILKMVGETFSKAGFAFLEWQDRAKERRRLLALEERTLQDTGANRVQPGYFGARPFGSLE